jgi:uncharacterized membrane protein YidH (DUF202 family)
MLQLVLLAAGSDIRRSWYVVPLVIAISLVWSASRYESTERILRRAGRLCLQITAFMAVILVVLLIASWGL